MPSDVELVIKARNEAARVLNQVEESLKALRAAQDNLGLSGGKTGDVLEQLEQQLTGLARQENALKTLSGVATQLDRMSAAITRLQTHLVDSQRALAENTAAVEKARTSQAELTGRYEETNAALARAKIDADTYARAVAEAEKATKASAAAEAKLVPALEASKAASKESMAAVKARNLEIKAAQAELERLQGLQQGLIEDEDNDKKAIDSVTRAIAQQTTAIEKLEKQKKTQQDAGRAARAETARLTEDLNNQRLALGLYNSQLEAQPALLEEARNRVAGYTEKLKADAGAKTAATDAAAKLGKQQGLLTGEVGKAEAALTKAQAPFEEIRARANELATSLGVDAAQADSLTKATERTTGAIESVTNALARQQQLARAPGAATTAGRTAVIAPTDAPAAAARQQFFAVRAAAEALANARATASNLGRELHTTADAGVELQAAFTVAKLAVDEAETSFRRERDQLIAMRQALRDAAQARRDEAQAAAGQRQADELAASAALAGPARQTVGAAQEALPIGPAAAQAAIYRALKAAVAEARTELENARKTAADLGRQLATTNGPLAELQQQFLAAKAAVQESDQALAASIDAFRREREAVIAARLARQAARDAAAEDIVIEREMQGVIATIAAEEIRLAAESRGAASAMQQLRTAFDETAGAAGRAAVGHSRLRSELAGLAIQFLGVYQAAHQLRDVFATDTALEAAQVRVTLALGQGAEAGAQAFEHLRSKSRDLALDIVQTTDSYGKFLGAVHGTVIEGPIATRVFDDLLTISRAFKLPTENLDRATVGLRDLAAQGKITQQFLKILELAVPAGFQKALADAAGKTIPEFVKQVHNGQAGLELLLPAFDSIAQRAESGLPAALSTSQSALQRFLNAVIDFREQIGKAGFLTAVTEALNNLSKGLASDAGVAAAQKLGGALAAVVQFINFLLQHSNVLTLFFGGLAAYKLVGLVTTFDALSASLRAELLVLPQVAAEFGLMGRAAQVAAVEAAALAAAETETAAATTLLGQAFVFFTGPIGIALGIAAIAGGLLTIAANTATATDTTISHQRVVEHLRDAYDKVGESTGNWVKALQKGALIDFQADIRKQLASISEMNDAIESASRSARVHATGNPLLPGTGNADVLNVVNLGEQFRSGTIDLDAFIARLNDLAKTVNDDKTSSLIKVYSDLAAGIRKAREELAVSATAAQKAGDTNKRLNDFIAQAPYAFDTASASIRKATDITDDGTTAWRKYQDAIEAVTKAFPALAKEARTAAGEADLVQLRQAAEALPAGTGDEIRARNAAISNVSTIEEKVAQERVLKALETIPGFTEQIKNFVARQIKIESGFNPQAGVGKQGAQGLFQFEPSSFVNTLRSIPEFDSLTAGKTDEQLALLRKGAENTELVTRVALEFTKNAAAVLQQQGLEINNTNLRLLSWLGTGGGTALLRANAANPNTNLASQVIRTNGVAAFNQNPAFQVPGRTTQDLLNLITKQVGGNAPLTSTGLTKGETEQSRLNEESKEALRLVQEKNDAKEISNRQEFITAGLLAQQNKYDKENAKFATENSTERVVFNDTLKRQLAEQLGIEYDKAHAQDEERKIVEKVVGLETQRKELIQSYRTAESQGAGKEADSLAVQIADVTKQLNAALPRARELANTFQDERSIGQLDRIDKELKQIQNEDALKNEKKALSDILGDEEKRKNLIQEYNTALQEGDTSGAEAFKKQIDDITKSLIEAIPKAEALANALGDKKAAGELEHVQEELGHLKAGVIVTSKTINEDFANDGVSAVHNFFQELSQGHSILLSLKDAVLQWASTFLQQIADMILKQLLLNAIQASGLGSGISGGINSLFGAGAGAAGAAAGAGTTIAGDAGDVLALARTGLIVGQRPSTTRPAMASWFANAQRFRGGGFPGLEADAIPVIAHRNEEILRANDPRNALNGGLRSPSPGGSSPVHVKVVNAFDSASVVSEGLASAPGERAIMNFVKSNSGAIKAILK